MKYIASFLLLMIIALNINAEDIIVLRNGDIIRAKVSEIDTEIIKYKKIINLSGPTYTSRKSEILSITYSNGEVEKFDEKNVSNARLSFDYHTPLFEEPLEDNENHIIKALSNIELSPNDFSGNNKKAKKRDSNNVV